MSVAWGRNDQIHDAAQGNTFVADPLARNFLTSSENGNLTFRNF